MALSRKRPAFAKARRTPQSLMMENRRLLKAMLSKSRYVLERHAKPLYLKRPVSRIAEMRSEKLEDESERIFRRVKRNKRLAVALIQRSLPHLPKDESMAVALEIHDLYVHKGIPYRKALERAKSRYP